MKDWRCCYAVAIVSVVSASCAEASGEAVGGDLTEAGVKNISPSPDLVLSYPNVGSGSAWPDLYRDVFGPTGSPSCVKQGACHGTEGSIAVSAGFACLDETRCEEAFKANFGYFTGVLRRRDGTGAITGFMPKQPEGIFSSETLDRIRQYGAANNLTGSL